MCQFSLRQAQISKHTPLGGVVILVVTTSIHPSHLLVGDVRLNQERARYAGTQSGVDFPLSGFSPEKGGRLPKLQVNIPGSFSGISGVCWGESPCHWRCHWVIGVFCFFQPCVSFSEVGDGWFFGEVKKTEVYFMFCDFQFPFEWLEWWPWLYYNTIHPVSVFVNTIDTASILGYNRPIYQPPLPAQWSY